MGRRRRSERGSVSIYFIAVTAAFVLLTGLLIDFARIAAFRKQAELAVKSGARSVLSAYDPNLYARYGLFARGGNPPDELFRQTLEGNVEPDGEGAWRLLDARWNDDAGVLESRPLASHDIFRREVLEEMKYKAPVDLAIELASRFRGIAPALKEAKASVDVLERMREAYDKREAALDAALEKQASAGRRLAEAVAPWVPSPPAQLSGTEPAGSAGTIAAAARMYDDYVRKREEDARRAEEQRQAMAAWQARKAQAEANGEDFEEKPPAGGEPLYSAEIEAYEQSVVRMAASLQQESAEASAAAGDGIAQSLESLAAAREANAEIRRIAEEAERMNVGSGSEAAVDDVDPDAFIGEDKAKTVRELRQSARDLAMEETFFDQYEEELNRQRSAGEETSAAASELASLLRGVPGSFGLGDSLRSSAQRLQELEADYRGRYGSEKASVIGGRKASFAEHRTGDERRRQLESEADDAWKGAASWLGRLSGGSDDEANRQAYRKLESLAQDNLKWNEAEEEQESKSSPSADPGKGRDEAMAASDGLLDALGEAAAGSRDSLYFSEYAAQRLAYAEPAEVREMLAGGGRLPADRQQLEYVLYGFGNAAGNIAAAYGEIFAVRLAIRTMEGLIENKSYGHPLVVLAAALLYAVEHALADMNQLLNEGTIPLSRYAKTDTHYLDYLRLFLLLHGDSASRIGRCIAVMEAATGLSFQRLYTYVSAEGTASLKLWFVPGLTKLLGQAGSWGGVVRSGRYEVTYRAEDSYL